MNRLFVRTTIGRFHRTRKVIKYAFIGSSVITGIGYGIYAFDEGFRRQCDFYLKAFPVLAHYTFVELTHKYLYEPTFIPFFKTNKTLDQKYEELHDKYAQFILDVILQLKGLYVKAGQFAASRPDIVPKCWIDKLRILQDGVPPRHIQYVKNVIESELGQSLEVIFSEFDAKSLGAASIGQAHYAKLRASPQNGISHEMEVCVKIQYPEMEKVFGIDLKSIRVFVSFLEPAIAEALQEMETQFLKEFDYLREAENLRTAFKNMNAVFADKVCVPQPINHLCTRNVLTMTYIPGEKLEIAIKKRLRQIYEMIKKNNDPLYTHNPHNDKEITLNDLRQEMFENNKGSFTPQISMKYYGVLLNIRRYLFNSLAFIFNYGIAWIFRPLCSSHDKLPYVPYDLPIVNDALHFIETLLEVHGYQIFVNGAFNGDPHPGNILLMPDGRLGLIDYGQFKYLSETEIYHLSKLYMALATRNLDIIGQQAKKMGVRTDKMDNEYIAKFTIFAYDRIDLEFREGKSTYQFLNELRQKDKVNYWPGNYYLVMRTVFLLRGLAALMQIDVSVAEHWQPYAKQFLLSYDHSAIATL